MQQLFSPQDLGRWHRPRLARWLNAKRARDRMISRSRALIRDGRSISVRSSGVRSWRERGFKTPRPVRPIAGHGKFILWLIAARRRNRICLQFLTGHYAEGKWVPIRRNSSELREGFGASSNAVKLRLNIARHYAALPCRLLIILDWKSWVEVKPCECETTYDCKEDKADATVG